MRTVRFARPRNAASAGYDAKSASTLNRVGVGGSRNPITSPSFGISKGRLARQRCWASRGRATVVARVVPSLRGQQLGVGSGAQPLRNAHRAGRNQYGPISARSPRIRQAAAPPVVFSVHQRAQLLGRRLPERAYISFAAIVLQDVNGRNLESSTRRERRSLRMVHLQRASPALDIAGALGFGGSGHDPGTLAHKTWSQIAESLANRTIGSARQVEDGLANLFTAAICRVTKDAPGSVCKSRGVRAAAEARRASSRPSRRRHHHRDPGVRIGTTCRARRGGLLRRAVRAECGCRGGPGAEAAAPRQALRQVHAVAAQASPAPVRATAAAAVLARATVPGIWINNREADAPPYGRNIFIASGQALDDLGPLSTPGREDSDRVDRAAAYRAC